MVLNMLTLVTIIFFSNKSCCLSIGILADGIQVAPVVKQIPKYYRSNPCITMNLIKATSWSTNDDIIDAHISATIQQILTKFSAVVSYVKQRQIGKFQLICT